MRECADDVSCLREQGVQRYPNTYFDRQVGKSIKMLGPSVLIGRTFLGPTPSTEYINTDKYIRPLNSYCIESHCVESKRNRITLHRNRCESRRIASCFMCIFNVSYHWLCIEMPICYGDAYSLPDEVREHLTRDQRPFLHPESLQTPLDSQLHVGASSLQFTSLIFNRVQVRGLEWPKQKLGFVHSDLFCVVFEVCVWIIVRLEDLNMAHYKISNRVSHLLICWYLINSWCHVSKQDV